jgi:hypothetical protein
MPEHDLSHRPVARLDGDGTLMDLRGDEGARLAPPGASAAGSAADIAALPQGEREQLARDFAEIERATAALRRAEPALESWTAPPPGARLRQPRPVWLLIGVLWLSTALVAAGAVAAIVRLLGSITG